MKKISTKILIGFLLVGLIPMITASFVSEHIASQDIEANNFTKYEAIRDIKKTQIENFFAERIGDITVLSKAIASFAITENGIKEQINNLDAQGKNFYENYMTEYGYYDLFLIDNDGLIDYTVAKEADYKTNLITGPYKDTNLGRLFREVSKTQKPTLIDFEPYAPSNDDPASFLAAPIMHQGEQLGIIALQIPLDPINNIMQVRSGMGETGETYLIGSDKLMRSDSYLDPEGHSVLSSFRNPSKGSVNTEGADQALNGKTDVKIIIDYNGNPVISAYSPINIHGLNWAILSEIDVAEAYESIYQLQTVAIIITIVMALLIIVVALMYAKNLSTPINRLTTHLNHIGTHFDFNKQCQIQSQDEIGEAGRALNKLSENIKSALDQVNHTMNQVASGNFKERISISLEGDLATLKTSVNASAESVDNTMVALSEVMDGISNGNFSVRMSDKVSGDVRSSVNNAMENMDNAIQEISEVIQKISKGEFDGRIQANLKGDMEALKNDVNTSVSQLETAMKEIIASIVSQSNADLTATISGNYQGELDTLKNSFNTSCQQLSNVIAQVINATSTVNIASSEVSSGSADLNERTQSQAASLEETAASMEELTATIKQNSDNAYTADRLANEAKGHAESGQSIMQETVKAIQEIHESSKKIEEIISLIDSIAFQTNLLALNAAVEAARAGEHGRGFAVVAGEVRNLAGKSADAARDIKELIENSVHSIENGTQKIEQTGDALEKINESIVQVTSIVSDISNASKEQQQGIDQINQAVMQIDQGTQQNAALVEETTAAAESLKDESDQLSQSVSGFKILGNNA